MDKNITLYRPIPQFTQKMIDRFWSKIDIKDENECWIWQRGLSHGYGVFGVYRIPFLSHRISYLLNYKTDPKEMRVCHTCDNTKCCNPKHFFLGTQADNIKDMISKGRYRNNKGGTFISSRNGNRVNTCKLNEEQVLEIRKLCLNRNLTNKEIGKKYGIGATAVQKISSRQNWKHLN